jgi:excisionase family DNA binding protein
MNNPFDILMEKLIEIDNRLANLPQVERRPQTEIIDTKTLCERLQLSEPTIISMRRRKQIPFFKVGSAIRFNWQAVIEALESKSKN